MKIFFSLFLSIFLFVGAAPAQTAEVTVSLNERFFDALLDAVFTNLKEPSFPIAQADSKFKIQHSTFKIEDSKLEVRNSNSFAANAVFLRTANESKITDPEFSISNLESSCDESIRLRREIAGVKTAVRFRDGKIFAPIAFAGSYNPPFVGCVDFQGYAEANVEIEFNKEKQTLIGRAKILNVVLSGTKGLGGAIITRFVQSSIDKRINPIEILQADKLTFLVPVQNAGGSLKMRATGVRTEIANGALNVFVAYEFLKG